MGLLAVALWAVPSAASAAPPSSSSSSTALSVRVQGNTLIDGSGNPIRLLGVDRSGAEYACAQGWGIFDGPTDATSVAAMAAWHINAVRVPLNEDCWLAVNGVAANLSGTAYRSAIASYVAALHNAGLIVILDLHWNAPGTTPAAQTGQQVMADADHSPAFWASVSSYFKNDPAVVFDLYNEPHDISWSCWRDGCRTSGGWQTAGMQQLVNAVRSSGATQPVMLGGLGWSSDLSQWLTYRPTDSANQEAASFHVYNFSGCNTASCWAATVAPVAAAVAVVTGEIGENDCASSFITGYMAWADAQGVSYLGWTWDTWDCSSGPALITAYDGTATAFGAGYRDHLAALAAARPATLTYPSPGQAGVDTTKAFTWTASSGAQAYWLVVGTTHFGTDLVNSGVLPAAQTSFSIPALPTGPTLYATLLTELAGTWRFQDLTFTAAPGEATFTYPVNGQMNVDSTRAFTWSPIPAGQAYILVIGSTVFGTDLLNSGVLPAGQSSLSVPALPKGKVLYATLLTKVNGAWTRYQLIGFITS
jgi:endoglucanase